MTEYSDDVLAKISNEIEALRATVSTFKVENIVPLQRAMVEKHKEEEEIYNAAMRAVEASRLERAKMQSEVSAFEKQMREMEMRLNSLGAEHAKALAAIAAREAIDEIRRELAEIMESAPWNDAIMDFQREDVIFIANAFKQDKNGVLIANDMGLGKTFEAAASMRVLEHMFAAKYSRKPRMLWLTKKSLLGSSMREINKWEPDRRIVLLGLKEIRKGAKYDRLIMGANANTRKFQVEAAVANNFMVMANYEALNTTPEIMSMEWDFIFMDEVHKLKGGANESKKSQVWMNAKELCHKANFLVPLSGTPIQNKPNDMWAYLHLFDPVKFPSVRRFEREYCFGWGEGVKVDFERLIQTMKGQVIRRRKDEVDIQLPDLNQEFIVVDMPPAQRKVYDQLRSSFFLWLDEQKESKLSVSAVIAQLTYLRQINIFPAGVSVKQADGSVRNIEVAESGKLDEAMELIRNLTEAGEQVVVFSSQFNEPLKELARRIEEEKLSFNGNNNDESVPVVAKVFTGEQSQKGLIAEYEQMFQNQECHVLLMNLKTGGEGFNLQKNPTDWVGGASNAIFLDLWWTPAANEQGEARIHRKGQTHGCMVYVIQTDDSVDAFIAEKLKMKQEMIDGIMESDEIRPAAEWKAVLEGLI